MDEIRLNEIKTNWRLKFFALLFIVGLICCLGQFFIDPDLKKAVRLIGEILIASSVVVLFLSSRRKNQ